VQNERIHGSSFKFLVQDKLKLDKIIPEILNNTSKLARLQRAKFNPVMKAQRYLGIEISIFLIF